MGAWLDRRVFGLVGTAMWATASSDTLDIGYCKILYTLALSSFRDSAQPTRCIRLRCRDYVRC